ncbi:MAG TPA: DUF4843 domain-containing protein, partial [Flavitalea sp.]|nr:DUF4843 domain-containing protein [Flavitalea sp.]
KRNAVVEFDAATWNSKAAGVNFPILTRVPPYGRAVNTPDPAITRASGTIKLRVNLVGPQFTEDKVFDYEVMASNTTAIAGYHYAPITGKYTIPAKSSFGEITIQLLNPGTATGYPKDLALQLISNPEAYASENYKIIVLRIAP